ncbi:YDG domain-containing protein [Pseudomonas synxantha]|uniref:YDG domain-containing protein n=1 Tax=Pseudomonas synxantha TaxID=47883 RepID=UPI0007048BCB|nr:YDG domain-containing protein [Pseudomonas synxantha]
MKNASLNHVYRLVWSDVAQAYVAVSEHTNARGKRGGLMATLAALGLLGASVAQAADLPTGGTIVGGAGSISQNGNHMVIDQSTGKLVTNWNSFDVGRDASVTFQQPNSASVALNRVVGGGNASQILGKLNANGQVWLLNPSGVVIGKGAQVNVGGLVASSLKISDEDFLAGKTTLGGGAGAGAVSNQGRITTTEGGVVALIGPQVSNSGVIHTPGGSTALAAGDKVSLDFTGDGLVSVNVDRGVLDALVQNSGQISADGGLVTLSARSADAAISSVVNNTGLIEAKGMLKRNGRIVLDGDDQGGSTQVAGVLDVSSQQGKGGDIVITGEQIALTGAALDASGTHGGGTVKVGGGWQGKDTSIANARRVTVDARTTVRADSTGQGDGGTAVFWADDSTRFAGTVSVRGGAQSGNGGKAEVSGKQTLQYSGVTDARASHGRTGDLLLDPATITVRGGGTAGDAITGSSVTEKALEAQTANVLLQATDSITFADLTQNGGDGTITMQNDVSFRAEAAGGSDAVISFANAANTLEVSGTGSIYMQAGGSGSGSIKNSFNLIAHGAGANPALADLPTHNVGNIGSGVPGAGSITLLGADGLTIAGAVSTHGGYVRLSSDSDTGGRGALTINTPINTAGGNLYLSFGATNYPESIATLTGDIALGAGRLYFGDAMGAKGLGGSTGEKRLGGKLTLNGDVNFSTPLTMLGGASIYTDGNINFTSNVKLDTGNDALTLRATNIDFTQATLQNVSTASLRLEPWNIATNISLDGSDGIATANTLGKLDNIMNLTIGRLDGTGTTTVNNSGFGFQANNSLTLLNGSIQVDGALQNTSSTGHVIARAGQADVVIGNAGSVTGKGSGDAVVLSAARNFINNAGSAALNASNSNGRWLTYSTSPEADVRGGLPLDFKQYNAHYGDTLAQSGGNGHIYTVAPKVAVGLTGEVSKTYDGDAHATVKANNFTATSGAIDGDDISLIIAGYDTASYDTKNAGSAKTVTVNGISLGEAQNGNAKVYGYQLVSNTASGDIGNIDKKVLTATADVSGKVYDGNTAAGLNNIQLVGVISGDVGNLDVVGNQGSFIDKNAGTGKSVTGTGISLGGAEAGNYSFNTGAQIGTGVIDKKTLTATADVSGKVYDGNTTASLGNVQLVGVVDGDADELQVVGNQGSFIDKNAGIGKSVTGTGISLAGEESGNYNFNTGAQIGTGVIDKKTLTATADVSGKVYDGNTTANLGNVQLVGVVDGDADELQVVGNQGSFIDKNAGVGKSVTGTGISLAGEEAGNYSFNTGAQIGTGVIDKKTLTATADVSGKVYDGNTTANLGNVQLVGVVDGDADELQVVGNQGSFIDKNAGVGKSVTGTGISLAGEEAGNYSFNTGAQIGTGVIDKKTLTATADVSGKVYDGNTTANLGNVQLVGVVDGDADELQVVGNQGSFIDKNAGVGKSVTGTGISLAGEEAGNYSFNTGAQIGTGVIDKKTLTATADVSGKVYDGNTTASLGNVQLVGVVDGDADELQVVGNQGSFIDKNAGVDKSVTGTGISLAGEEAGNYSFNTGAQIGTGVIDKKTLTAAVDIADKLHDGSTTATIRDVTLGGVVAGDSVGAIGSADFLTPGAGRNKPVAVIGLQLIGNDFANYQLASDRVSGSASVDAPLYTPVGLLGKTEGANGTALTANQPQTRPDQAAARYTQPMAATALVTNESAITPRALDIGANAPLRGDLLSANGNFSLVVEDGVSTPATKNVLNLYSSHAGKELLGQGKYAASDMGNNILLEKVASTLRNLPMLQEQGVSRSQGSVALGTGELLLISVSMLKDATLLVEAEPVTQALSNEELATYGLAIAKQHLGVTVDSIKNVVIEHSPRQGSAGQIHHTGVVSR